MRLCRVYGSDMDMMTGTLREGGSIYCWRCNPQIKVQGLEVGQKKPQTVHSLPSLRTSFLTPRCKPNRMSYKMGMNDDGNAASQKMSKVDGVWQGVMERFRNTLRGVSLDHSKLNIVQIFFTTQKNILHKSCNNFRGWIEYSLNQAGDCSLVREWARGRGLVGQLPFLYNHGHVRIGAREECLKVQAANFALRPRPNQKFS